MAVAWLAGAVWAASLFAGVVFGEECKHGAACKNAIWSTRAEMLEYTAHANPPMAEVPVIVFPPTLHQSGPSRVEKLDLKESLKLDFPATSPNLMANFVRIRVGEELPTGVSAATSQSYYVIRGSGMSQTREGNVSWREGDLFVLPYLGDEAAPICDVEEQCVIHSCDEDPHFGGCALYWVHDEPLLRYLGVRPNHARRFEPTLYEGSQMRETVGSIPSIDEFGLVRNRRGILLSNPASMQTRTLTPTMWSLLNSIDGNATQHPHKHNSVALDLAVSAGQEGTVYTLLGRELDAEGNIVNATRATWQSGGAFVTPPGWWHSHHNEGSSRAWVLPMQDAGLYTHQRTLDIRFVDEEKQRLKKGVSRGATTDSTQEVSAEPVVAGTLAFGHV